MRLSIWISAVLGTAVFAAPDYQATITPRNANLMNRYFQLLVSKVKMAKSAVTSPACDLGNAVMPSSSSPLPPPSAGLTLKHVAIGRGTQNYTCGSNATAPPVLIGAKATLFNCSCIASTYPDVLSLLPGVMLQFGGQNPDDENPTPASLAVSGHHFFTRVTTPFFNLNTDEMQLGQVPCEKNNSVSAPPGAMLGQDNVGFGSVAWLKLKAKAGATGGLQEVYRLNTAGGAAPATCSGMPSAFEIQYAAEYWFWST